MSKAENTVMDLMGKSLLLLCLIGTSVLTTSAASAEGMLKPRKNKTLSKISVAGEFSYGNVANPFATIFGGDDEGTLIGIRFAASYALSEKLVLGAELPIAHGRFNNDSATSLGNLGLHGSYTISSAAKTSSWLNFGLSLETADDDGEAAAVAQAFSLYWIPNPGMYAVDTTTLRLSYGHSLALGKANEISLQAGLQYLINDGDNSWRFPLQAMGRFEIQPGLSVLAGLGLYIVSDEVDNNDELLSVVELGIGSRKMGRGNLQALLYYPLDDSYRDDFHVWGVRVGYTSSL